MIDKTDIYYFTHHVLTVPKNLYAFVCMHLFVVSHRSALWITWHTVDVGFLLKGFVNQTVLCLRNGAEQHFDICCP